MIKQRFLWRALLFAALTLLIGQLITANVLRAAENTATTTNSATSSETNVDVCALPTTSQAVYLPIITSTNNGSIATPAPMASELQYEVGKTYSYRYEFSSFAVFGTVDKEHGISDTEPNITLAYGTAKISITALEDGDIFVGQIVLDNPVLCEQNGDEPDFFLIDDEALTDLQTPLIFKQHKNGVIVDVQIADSVDPVTANQLKSVLNSLQATLTDDSDYPAIENGAQGSYVAHYETALQQNGLQFTRTIDDGSFIEFHSQGDEPGIALTNSIQSFLDRDKGVFSRVSFHEKTNIMGDPNEIDLDTIEGVVLWGNTESEGLLRLTTVENTTAEQLAARAILTYHSADMGVVFSELRESSHGIDMETLDLDAELDALEADPTNAALFTRMTWIITAAGESDSDNTALEAIGKRLANEPANEDVALVYIDLLGHDGSWYSQDQLLPLIDPANGGARAIPERLQQQAIINLALVDVPQPATYAMIQAIRDDPAAAGVAQDMANEALGAMVPALRKCDPAAGEAIMADLELQLAAATTDQEKHQLLLALGNTESADLLPTVQPYLTSQNDMVQWAAYWALRDVPGQEAEDVLLKAFDDDWGFDPGYPLPAAALALKNKPGKPSDNANDTLAAYWGDESPWPNPTGDVFEEKWDYEMGGKKLGGNMPGNLIWKSPPYTDHLEAIVTQSVDYHLDLPTFSYSKKGTLAQAIAFTRPKDGNDAIQEFGYDYTIMGKSYNVDYSVSCADSDDGTISSGTREIVHQEFEYPIWWIVSVGVELDVAAYYSIDYSYAWDVCDVTEMDAEVNLIPSAGIHAAANGNIAVELARGGVELDADVIDVKIPAKLKATYSLQEDFEACATIPIQWKALDVDFNVFADRRKLNGDWERMFTKKIWNYTVSAGSKELLNECWTPPEN